MHNTITPNNMQFNEVSPHCRDEPRIPSREVADLRREVAAMKEKMFCGVQLVPAYTPARGTMPSILEQYRISDFLEWNRQKALEINTDFQRGGVWQPAARTMLIDTILRQLPIPKVYLRTKINVQTQRAVREIIDGQQRLKAIIDFGEGRMRLTKRAREFNGFFYNDLNEEQKTAFLGYPIAVDQLVNASIDDVLEVFARLNSYTVSLNGPEKRHAHFQGEFKFAIREASRRWGTFWKNFGVLSTHQRVRMMDDSLTAEMVGILLEGVKDGGDPKIYALYSRNNQTFDGTRIQALDRVLQFISDEFAPTLTGTPLMSPPHLLILFSALAFIREGIPLGDLRQDEVDGLPHTMFNDLNRVRDNLLLLATTIDSDEDLDAPLAPFWKASHSSTQRIASRRIRFPYYMRALGADNVI